MGIGGQQRFSAERVPDLRCSLCGMADDSRPYGRIVLEGLAGARCCCGIFVVSDGLLKQRQRVFAGLEGKSDRFSQALRFKDRRNHRDSHAGFVDTCFGLTILCDGRDQVLAGEDITGVQASVLERLRRSRFQLS